ncbi:hypothetical protein L0128_20880 [candidate division KSB1 bacterium]|nr:hypothetical protein [candidate division KSB1 bacterium]
MSFGFNKLMSAEPPEIFRKRIILELFEATATAFGVPIPALREETSTDLLQQYAIFTATNAEKILATGADPTAIQQQLFENARRLGQTVRRVGLISTTAKAMEVAAFLYKIMQIEFTGNPYGEITITRCYFSQYYSCAVCQFISAIDAGILTGLAGGGRLVFNSRITAGDPCCKAHFYSKWLLKDEVPNQFTTYENNFGRI